VCFWGCVVGGGFGVVVGFVGVGVCCWVGGGWVGGGGFGGGGGGVGGVGGGLGGGGGFLGGVGGVVFVGCGGGGLGGGGWKVGKGNSSTLKLKFERRLVKRLRRHGLDVRSAHGSFPWGGGVGKVKSPMRITVNRLKKGTLRNAK